ncbi:MAG: NPCBM/NEW2 domain-containing protein [Chloroflexi bacterium]|nr:NPCBM/NEW2 domain-containing protein [Chloroflexota bacterium]MCL5025332.1 NPCBM/NEW2 domain-containing protein [Chloroflexota bacterium]
MVVGLLTTVRLFRLGMVMGSSATLLGQWVYLSDLPWEEASTGWLAVANDNKPARDAAFSGSRLLMRGTAFEKGLGTYPLSQITYRLGGQYALFEAYAGLNDDSHVEGAEVHFMVMLDGILVYNSGPFHQGDAPRRIELFVNGGDELRLVTQAGADAGPAYTNWADARLLRSFSIGEEAAERNMRHQVELQQQARDISKERDNWRIAGMSAGVARIFDGQGSDGEHRTRGEVDVEHDRLLLSNDQLGLVIGYGGVKHGLLTLLQRSEGQVALYDAAPAVDIAPGHRLDLHEDTEPDGFVFRDVSDPVFGQGKELEISLRADNGLPWHSRIKFTLFDGQPYLLMRMLIASTDGQEVGTPRFRFFQATTPNLIIGEDLQYITDFSRVRHFAVPDDGLLYREAMGYGKPLYLWSDKARRGILLSIIDEARTPSRFSAQVDSGQVRGRLGLSADRIDIGSHQTVASSPTLYLEMTGGRGVAQAFDNYRSLMARRYPPLALPDWVRYQWLSWYVYYMDIDEDEMRHQIDYIAENLGDLGPWHIIVDAGWYVAEGREGADWRNVDKAKFPNGLRSLVDYAHERGVRVVLYFSAPYLDSRQRAGDWLGLRNIIEQHPDWLVRLGEETNGMGSTERASYIYDFANPGLRQYLQEVMQDYFVRYDVDGIKIDGLGNAEGALLTPDRLDPFGLVERAAAPTMGIYRFIWRNVTDLKPDAYIEAGWMTPLFANRYSHTFRYGDERAAFSSDYPFPGLIEHIDYAVLQKLMLGQRPNMGAITDDPNQSEVNRQWIEAALALGTQISLSFSLPEMNQDTLSAYRSLLVHYDPFKGKTKVSSLLRPEVFATVRDETAYLGLLNRDGEPKEFTVTLADYGLDPTKSYLAYDVEENAFQRINGTLHTIVPGKGLRLYLLRSTPGVVWTNSSFDTVREGNGNLMITVRGPASPPGNIAVYVPRPRAVYLDGQPLSRTRMAALRPGTFSYNNRIGVLRLQYDHKEAHEIRVEVQ